MLSDLVKILVRNTDLSGRVKKAIEYINDSGMKSMFPRPRTITSFLNGAETSPFYSFFSRHIDVCGSFPGITLAEVTEELNKAVFEGSVLLVGLDYRLNKSPIRILKDIDKIFLFSESSKKFDESFLLNLTDWETGHNSTTNTKFYRTLDGWDFPCDSNEESSVVAKLSNRKYYKALRGQSLAISYPTFATQDKNYFPDIVMLDYMNRIAIIEVKQLFHMSNIYSILKYRALKDFCQANGFICAMCDRDLKTYEYLEKFKIDPEIKMKFTKLLSNFGCFQKDQLSMMIENMTAKEQNRVLVNLHALVIQRRYINRDKYGKFDIRSKETFGFQS